MPLLSYSQAPAKGSSVTATLNRATLLGLPEVAADPFWSVAANVSSVIVTLKPVSAGGKIVVTFPDFSLASPSSALSIPLYTRNEFAISKITMIDFMGDKLSFVPSTLGGENISVGADGIAPVLADPVLILQSTFSTIDVSWSAASDNVSAAEQLSYKVVYSDTNNISTIADAEANGSLWLDWALDTYSSQIDGLQPETAYYISVLVKDEAGNVNIYNSASIATEAVPTYLIQAIYDSGEAGGAVKFYNQSTLLLIAATADPVYPLKGIVSSGVNVSWIGGSGVNPESSFVYKNGTRKEIPTDLGYTNVAESITAKSNGDLIVSGYRYLDSDPMALNKEPVIWMEEAGQFVHQYNVSSSGSSGRVKSVTCSTGTNNLIYANLATDNMNNFGVDIGLYDSANDTYTDNLFSMFNGVQSGYGNGYNVSNPYIKLVADNASNSVVMLSEWTYYSGMVPSQVPLIHFASESSSWFVSNIEAPNPSGEEWLPYMNISGVSNLYDDAAIDDLNTLHVVGHVIKLTESGPREYPAIWTLDLSNISTNNMATCSVLNTAVSGLGEGGKPSSVKIIGGKVCVSGYVYEAGAQIPATWVDGALSVQGSLPGLTSGSYKKGLYIGEGAQASPDVYAPVPFEANVMVSGITASGLMVEFYKAFEPGNSNLQYKIVRSSIDNINTVEDAEANGTVVSNWATRSFNEAYVGSYNVTGLLQSSTYYFNVLVKDAAGNKSIYKAVSAQTTMLADPFVDLVLEDPTGATYTITKDSLAQQHTINVNAELPAGGSIIATLYVNQPLLTTLSSASIYQDPGNTEQFSDYSHVFIVNSDSDPYGQGPPNLLGQIDMNSIVWHPESLSYTFNIIVSGVYSAPQNPFDPPVAVSNFIKIRKDRLASALGAGVGEWNIVCSAYVLDSDSDMLSDGTEAALGTNPNLADTDGDGVIDGIEVAGANTWGVPTNPLAADTDSDGLNDGQENTYNTDPTNPDTDFGGVEDGQEVLNGTDPNDPGDDNA